MRGCAQMLATVIVLWVGKAARVISFPDFDESIPRKVRPPIPVFLIDQHDRRPSESPSHISCFVGHAV